MNKLRSITFAVVLPLVLIVAWWARIEMGIAGASTLIVPVSGYDPRDLLSGHYLTYRVDFAGATACPADQIGERCLCFRQATNEITWSGSCLEKPQACNLFLRGTCSNSRFEAGIERYYFPEEFAEVLTTVPANADIIVKIDQSGLGTVTNFLVEGRPLEEWARDKKAAPR